MGDVCAPDECKLSFFQAEIRSYASDATSGHWLRTAMDGIPLRIAHFAKTLADEYDVSVSFVSW